MRNLLALLGAAVVTFVVVGWFLGWYRVKTNPGADGHRQVHIDFNSEKIKTDLDKGKTRLFGLIEVSTQQASTQTVTPGQPGSSLPQPPAPGPLPQPPLPGQPGGAVGPVLIPPAPGSGPSRDGDTWIFPKR